jgi:hypothetical protein
MIKMYNKEKWEKEKTRNEDIKSVKKLLIGLNYSKHNDNISVIEKDSSIDFVNTDNNNVIGIYYSKNKLLWTMYDKFIRNDVYGFLPYIEDTE